MSQLQLPHGWDPSIMRRPNSSLDGQQTSTPTTTQTAGSFGTGPSIMVRPNSQSNIPTSPTQTTTPAAGIFSMDPSIMSSPRGNAKPKTEDIKIEWRTQAHDCRSQKRYIKQEISWETVQRIQNLTSGTNYDEVYTFHIDTYMTKDNESILFQLATGVNQEQVNRLQSSHFYKAFTEINASLFGDSGQEINVPGKEIINGQEVFTLFDDEEENNRTFGGQNTTYGKMRYFDAQTGRELYTWLPEGVNIRDTEKVRNAINNLENMDKLSLEQRAEIVNFYFNNVDIENLNDDEKKMLRSMYYTSNTYTNPEKEIEYCQKVATPYIENELKKNREDLQHYKAELEELEKTVTYTYKNEAEFWADLNATKEDGTRDHERFDKAAQFHHKLVLQRAISTLETLISCDEFELGQINNKVENLRGTK